MGQKLAERTVPPVRLFERGAQVGGALLEDGPEEFGVGHDPGLDQVEAELGVAGPVEVVGQQVVPEHQLARHPERRQHDGGHPPGAVLAGRAVVEQRQPPGRAHQPQRGAERLPLPGVRHEPAVHLGHERRGAPVAEFAPLLFVVAAGDELAEGTEVAAADRQVSEFDAVGQPVVAAQQDLARAPEVDDGAHPEPVEPVDVAAGQLAERVAAEQPAASDFEAVDAPVAADVPHVHRALENNVARRASLSGHHAPPNVPPTSLRVTLIRRFTSMNAGYSGCPHRLAR